MGHDCARPLVCQPVTCCPWGWLSPSCLDLVPDGSHLVGNRPCWHLPRLQKDFWGGSSCPNAYWKQLDVLRVVIAVSAPFGFLEAGGPWELGQMCFHCHFPVYFRCGRNFGRYSFLFHVCWIRFQQTYVLLFLDRIPAFGAVAIPVRFLDSTYSIRLFQLSKQRSNFCIQFHVVCILLPVQSPLWKLAHFSFVGVDICPETAQRRVR